MMKQLIKKLISKTGYKVTSTKYVLEQFKRGENLLKLDFDHVLSRYLVHDKPAGDFFFIQIGAFDGILCDPLVKYLKMYDWKGIMIEPQPSPFKNLSEMYRDRPEIKVKNAAISNSVGQATLYTLEGEDLPEWAKGM